MGSSFALGDNLMRDGSRDGITGSMIRERNKKEG